VIAMFASGSGDGVCLLDEVLGYGPRRLGGERRAAPVAGNRLRKFRARAVVRPGICRWLAAFRREVAPVQFLITCRSLDW